MASLALVEMRLVSCIELDPRTFQMTVRERWSEKRWIGSYEHERQSVYTWMIGVGSWHDGNAFLRDADPRRVRLTDLFGAWRISQKLDAYVFGKEEPRYVLPPVPVLPRR